MIFTWVVYIALPNLADNYSAQFLKITQSSSSWEFFPSKKIYIWSSESHPITYESLHICYSHLTLLDQNTAWMIKHHWSTYTKYVTYLLITVKMSFPLRKKSIIYREITTTGKLIHLIGSSHVIPNTWSYEVVSCSINTFCVCSLMMAVSHVQSVIGHYE